VTGVELKLVQEEEGKVENKFDRKKRESMENPYFRVFFVWNKEKYEVQRR